MLSVVIVNHRSEEVLPQCLDSIAASKLPFEIEVIVVDNPALSQDPDPRKKYPFEIKKVRTEKRVGFAKASNRGAALAGGDYLLFLNPDIILSPNAINILHESLKSNSEIGLATGRLTYPDGRFQPSCRRFPALKNLFFSRQSIIGKIFPGGADAYTLPDFDRPTEVDAAAAALAMLSKKLFDELGGFDERFPLYLEDTDLSLRIHRSGKSIVFVPAAQAVHLWGHSTGHYRFRRIIWHHLSMWRYFSKHRRTVSVFLSLPPLLIANCLLSLTIELFTLRR